MAVYIGIQNKYCHMSGSKASSNSTTKLETTYQHVTKASAFQNPPSSSSSSAWEILPIQSFIFYSSFTIPHSSSTVHDLPSSVISSLNILISTSLQRVVEASSWLARIEQIIQIEQSVLQGTDYRAIPFSSRAQAFCPQTHVERPWNAPEKHSRRT